MKKKRILFLFVTLFASTLLYSQVVGVKTNVVMDALKIINLGAEGLVCQLQPLDIQRSEDDEDACLPTGTSILVL